VQIGLCELANDRHRKPVKQTNRVSVERELYTGALKMQDRKMQDLKMQDQIAGHENAGPNRRA